MLGRLTIHALSHGPVELVGIAVMGLSGLAAVAALTYLKRWRWLWREWLTTVDPKKIGVMYLIVAGLMLLRGGVDAVMMRAQQATSVGPSHGFLNSDHFQQVFSAHGTIMIFFVAMGFMFGLINLILPLQLGSRDVAFPFLNATSFWLFASGMALINLSLVLGEFSAAGWLAYPPLSELKYSPGVGVDYWIWSLQIAGIGSLLSGINFFSTIIKMRRPGMTMMRMPMFAWSVMGSMSLVIFAFPILTATLAMLSLDRLIGTHFFTSDFGGNPMMYVNLIWSWGHPEVYILILPAFGVFSEVVPTFSQKRLFGYTSMVIAIWGIVLLSFLVWLHHFFTMGAGADVNAVFGIATSLIAVATGVKVFNWIFTMYGGAVRFTTPMLWSLGFIVTFVLGGMTGVLLAVPPADFQLHNSLFLVAHFHNVIIGGVVFGAFAGISYWFPKAFGFRLHEGWGKAVFWLALAGFYIVFMPLYVAGLLGMTRRLQHYDVAMWRPWMLIAAIGIVVMAASAACQVIQLVVSIRRREELRDITGDPWDGRSLEWATSSPPPAFNFAVLPQVSGAEPYWEIKRRAIEAQQLAGEPHYEAIELPRNSPTGFITAFFATLTGFALIWHIWWLMAVGLVCAYAVFVWFAWREVHEKEIPAAVVARLDRDRRRARAEWLAQHAAGAPA
jgi:cytochrome o ubiquinol oxidase subunit I